MREQEAAPRVLVVGPAWIGDMVMAESLFQILKQRRPAPHLHVLASAWTRPLLERMPEVDATLELAVGHGRLQFAERRRLALALRELGYTQAILLPNSWKSALVPFWAAIPRRTGWRGEMRWGLLNDLRHLNRRQLPTTVQRFAALGLAAGDPVPDLEALPWPRLQAQPEAVQTAMARLGLVPPAGQRLLALCPGAEFGPAKQWPAAYFGALAAQLRGQGWRVWLFGSDQDRPVCAAVQAAAGGGCDDLAGRTSLADRKSVV
jgi:heptosyltransferase-2